MTGLLVSVRDADEARLAIEAGVDLVDVKEPLRGPLGAADRRTIRQIVAAVAGAATAGPLPVSVALGELGQIDSSPALPAEPGVRYAKIGLAGCARDSDWQQRLREALGRLPSQIGRVAVAYADWTAAGAPPPDEILAAAAGEGCAAALVDTYDKSAGSLLDHWSRGQIAGFIAGARQRGMLAVVGGGLTRDGIAEIVSLGPDYVAVRGAACRGSRSGTLDRQRMRRLVELIRRHSAGFSRVQSGA